MGRKFTIIAFIFFGALLLSIKFGTTQILWSQLLSYLLNSELPQNVRLTLEAIRIPRTFSVLYVGAMLAVAGAVLQALLRNPLADSYTLGLSGGSAAGAALALVLSLAPTFLWIPLFSIFGALLSVLIVLFLSRKTLKYESRTLILVGIMLSLFLGALSIFLVSLLSQDRSQSALHWLMGEFGSARDSWALILFLISLPAILYIFLRHSSLDALSLGDVKALSLGFAPQKEKVIFIVLSTTITALAISISGLVGFIGLVSPHIARRFLKTSINKFILPGSLLIGSSLLLFADTLGRVILAEKEIPAGSFSALIGAPVLIYMLMENKNAYNE